jgi:hypothetical protein
VTASGASIRSGESVRALGFAVPVDESGRFVFQQLVPRRVQTGEIAVTDAQGATRAYRRDFELPERLVLRGPGRPHRGQQQRERPGRDHDQRQEPLRRWRLERRPHRRLRQGPAERPLDAHRQRRHRGAPAEGAVSQPRPQGPDLAVPPLRPRRLVEHLRRRLHHHRGRAHAGPLLPARGRRPLAGHVGQLQAQLRRHRAHPREPRPVRLSMAATWAKSRPLSARRA